MELHVNQSCMRWVRPEHTRLDPGLNLGHGIRFHGSVIGLKIFVTLKKILGCFTEKRQKMLFLGLFMVLIVSWNVIHSYHYQWLQSNCTRTISGTFHT